MGAGRAGGMPVIMAWLWSMCCLAGAATAQEAVTASAADILPPLIEHEPLSTFPAGMPLRIQARVTDDSGVRDVILFYRPAGSAQYRQLPMLRAPGASLYAANLPPGLGPRIEYFIRASDSVGNSVLGNLFDPHLITVTAAVEPVAHASAAPASAPVPAAVAFDDASERVSGARPERGVRRWVWVGVGVLAAAALASAGGGGGGTGAPPAAAPRDGDTGPVTISAPLP
jgi:hypothetical protein